MTREFDFDYMLSTSLSDIRIIFLDVDGVLNNHEWCHDKTGFVPRIHRQAAKQLYLLIDRSEAKVVLISSWRGLYHDARHLDLRGFSVLFKTHGIQNMDIIDVLDPHDKNLHHRDDRTMLINEWVADHPPKSYVVLDDLELGVQNLIRPSGHIGLRENDVKNAMAMFESQEALH